MFRRPPPCTGRGAQRHGACSENPAQARRTRRLHRAPSATSSKHRPAANSRTMTHARLRPLAGTAATYMRRRDRGLAHPRNRSPRMPRPEALRRNGRYVGVRRDTHGPPLGWAPGCSTFSTCCGTLLQFLGWNVRWARPESGRRQCPAAYRRRYGAGHGCRSRLRPRFSSRSSSTAGVCAHVCVAP
jgi:hypothetical protein